jgi:tetratricopeptide (TPR) repeat protein
MARARQGSALAKRDTPQEGVRTGQSMMPSPLTPEWATSQPGIIGRDAECARIAAVVADPAATTTGMLLLEGEPGIGKSTLWQYGVGIARRSGHRVLEARPGRAEQSLTYAGLAALLPDPLLDETLPMLPIPRRQALEVALLRASGPTANAVTVGLAVGSLLQALASGTRVILAIDDIQWLDAVTTQVLEFALRRAPRGQVLVLATRRITARHPETNPLEAVFQPDACVRIEVGPLSVGALGALVRHRLHRTLPRLRATRLHQSCGGNPLLGLELVRVTPAHDTRAAPGEPFPISPDAVTLLGQRIVGLSAAARSALLTAALAAGPTPDLLDRVLGTGVAETALAELTASDLVRVDGGALRCAHPLIAAAAWTTASPAHRRRAHLRLAAKISDVEQRARHLALGTDQPDEQVARALDDAASQARLRGATDTAAELAELAVRLTPLSAKAEAAARELAVARHRLDAGHADEALAAAKRAAVLLPPGSRRVDALLMIAAIEGERSEFATARTVARQALAEAGDDNAALARAHIGLAFWAYEDLASDLGHARAALDLLGGNETDDPKTAATAMLLVGGDAILTGQGIDLDMLDRAVELERLVPMSIMERPSTHRAIYIGHAGRYRESITLAEGCLAKAEQEGDWAVRPHILRVLAWFEFCLGRFDRALARYRQGTTLAEELGLDDAGLLVVGSMVTAATGGMGEPLAEQAVARARAVHDRRAEVDALKAMGFVLLTRGEPNAAVEPLTEAARSHAALGLIEPGWTRLHGDWIEALLAAGDLARARQGAAEFHQVAVAGGHPWSLMVSARCLGLLAEADDRPDEAITWFGRSLAADPDGEMRFERARTLVAMGRVQRPDDRGRSHRHRTARRRPRRGRTHQPGDCRRAPHIRANRWVAPVSHVSQARGAFAYRAGSQP